MSLESDLTTRHYQPAGRSTWCGAKGRVLDAERLGTIARFSALRVLTTTDISKVRCSACLEIIKASLKTIAGD